ncbi:class II aldolase/adducin family protein [Planctomycetota bacterium]
MTEAALRDALAALSRRIQEHGYVVATDGNCSARMDDGRFLITPSGVRKGEVGASDLVLCNADGGPLEPPHAVPSSEARLHAVIYAERPDVGVVCHAHPTVTVALSLAGQEVAACLLPEILIAVGTVATATYGTPTTKRAAEVVRRVCRGANAIVLDRHGSVTLGRDCREAFHCLE